MKTQKLLVLFLLLVWSHSITAHPLDNPNPDKDTIIVTFGKKGKMVIYVDNKEDLQALKAYDINALLSKLNIYLDSAGQEDYMNDTTFTFNTPVSLNGQKSEQEVKVRIESLGEKFNKIEDNVSKTVDNAEKIANDFKKITISLGQLNIDINNSEEGDNKLKVKASRKKEDSNKKHKNYFNLYLGFNNYIEKDHIPINDETPYSLDMWRSRYASVNWTSKNKITGPIYFTYGLEIAFNNYMFRDNTRVGKANGVVTFDPIETANRGVKKSKLATTYFNVPVMLLLDYPNKFKFGFGGYVGYRLGSHGKIKYTSGDNPKEKYRNNFYLNDLRYGLKAQIGYSSYKFFINYDLNTLFREDKGPQLNSFSFGIIL